MATPARLEEGYEMDTSYQSTGTVQQLAETVAHRGSTTRSPGATQSAVEPPETLSEAHSGHSNLRRESDIKNAAPRGWPSIAATQMYYTNFRIHRRFSYLTQRLLIDQETKLAYLENKLEELDKEDERSNTSNLRSLPFDPDRLLATCNQVRSQPQPITPEQPLPTSSRDREGEQGGEYVQWKDKDLLLEAMVPRMKSYFELLQLSKDMQKLPPISRREHNAFYDEIRQYHTLDEPAYQFLYQSDDFVATVTDRVHQYFEALVYGDSPIMKRIKRLIGREHNNHNNHNQDRAPTIGIDEKFFVVPIKVLVAFTSGVLLLSPVAILFLGDLSRGASFGVVVAFIFLFVAVMSSLNTNWDTILVGLSAYMAVLVTFLSNLEQRLD
ncbi:hypothetical protein F5Y04DRAFT_254254 [Hypomontagnella monticulosa]|nr:hypothetical protein F5Y04DRAFT_254254 [Hypomontagnella monticulosa]